MPVVVAAAEYEADRRSGSRAVIGRRRGIVDGLLVGDTAGEGNCQHSGARHSAEPDRGDAVTSMKGFATCRPVGGTPYHGSPASSRRSSRQCDIHGRFARPAPWSARRKKMLPRCNTAPALRRRHSRKGRETPGLWRSCGARRSPWMLGLMFSCEANVPPGPASPGRRRRVARPSQAGLRSNPHRGLWDCHRRQAIPITDASIYPIVRRMPKNDGNVRGHVRDLPRTRGIFEVMLLAFMHRSNEHRAHHAAIRCA